MQVKVTRIQEADWNLLCNLARATVHKDTAANITNFGRVGAALRRKVDEFSV